MPGSDERNEASKIHNDRDNSVLSFTAQSYSLPIGC